MNTRFNENWLTLVTKVNKLSLNLTLIRTSKCFIIEENDDYDQQTDIARNQS